MGGAVSIQTASHAAVGARSSSHVGGGNQIQIATHAGVQAKEGPTAVHVGAANQETQSQTVDQDMADAQTDQDMADLAVVQHPHPHEDEERKHTDTGYFDEDDGTTLDLVQVRGL